MKFSSPIFLPFLGVILLGTAILALGSLTPAYTTQHAFVPITEGTGTADTPFTAFILAYEDTGTIAVPAETEKTTHDVEDLHLHHHEDEHEHEHVHEVQLFYQYFTTEGVWSPEHALYTNTDMEDESGRVFSKHFFTHPATKLRITARDQHGDIVDYQSPYMEAITFRSESQLALKIPTARATSFVVSREEWGADNGLITEEGWNAARTELCKTKSWYCTPASPEAIKASRDKQRALEATYPDDTKTDGSVTEWNGKALYWTVRKSAKVKKLFVHHTASLNKDQNRDGVIDQTDERLVMQSTYYFHTILRGWGDIGYNYIIGPTGTIYEGRFGGDRAVGAHAVWRNISSIGVSVMGNFQDEYMTEKQKNALIDALAALSQYYGLDPTGNTTFYNITGPSILGHRDSDEAATACPGTRIYEILPDIRKRAKERLAGLDSNPVVFPGFATKMEGYVGVLESKMTTQSFAAGTAKTITIPIKNAGAKIWDSTTFLQLRSPLSIFAVESGNQTEALAARIQKPTSPGETAVFELTLKPGLSSYNGNITLVPLANGKFVLQDVVIPVSVPAAKATFQEIALDVNKSSGYMIGDTAMGSITLKNTGDVPWEKDGKFAFYVDVIGSTNNFTFETVSTLRLSTNVAPGSNVTLPFQFNAPLFQGVYFLSLVPKIQNYSLLLGPPSRKTLTILHPSQVPNLQLSLTGPSKVELTTGSKKEIVLTLKNTGSERIPNIRRFTPEVRLGSDAQSVIFAGAAQWVQEELPANGEINIRVPLEARSDNFEKNVPIQIVLNTLPLAKDPHTMTMSVPKKVMSGSMTMSPPSSLKKDSPVQMTVRLTNTGTVTWPTGTRVKIKQQNSLLSNPTWYSANTLMVLEQDLGAGQSLQIERLLLPKVAGTLIEEFILEFPSGELITPTGNKLSLQVAGQVPGWVIPLQFGELLSRWK